MSFLRRGRRTSRAIVTVCALVGFQLAIVGAGVAYASTCIYNPATDTINITIDAGEFVSVAVENATDDLDTESPPGSIVADLDGLGYENGAASTACGSATNSNTVAIIVLGQPSADETFSIDELAADPFNTAIAWNVDLGTNTVGGVDELEVLLNGDQDNTIVLTNTSFNLNGASGELLGAEQFDIDGDDGDDTIDASAVTILTDRLHGHDGDDVIMPGTNDDPDVSGGDDDDTLSYGTRTTAVFVDNGTEAGADLNGDGDNDDAGEETDSIDCFETVVTGSGNDTLTDSCGPTVFVPGDGNDDITGDGNDTIDWSSSSAGMVIDVPNESATGQGTDTWDMVTMFVGSPFDDTLLTDGSAPGAAVDTFSGGAGVDTVDGSADTSAGITIDLDALDPAVDDLENAIGGTGSDTLDGNDLRNTLNGGDGDDDLDGGEGNDTLIGGLGNDDFDGEEGADRASFIDSPNGVHVDLSLGFATGEGDDSFEGSGVEIIVGSDFNDEITGGPFSGGGTVNFLFNGRGGNDVLTGFNGNDTLRGGRGDDVIRGVGGDDNLAGAAGDDRLFGGQGTDVGRGGRGDDICRGVEIQRSCGTRKAPRAPQTARLI